MRKLFLTAAVAVMAAAALTFSSCGKDTTTDDTLTGTVWEFVADTGSSVITFADGSNAVKQEYYQGGALYRTYAFSYVYEPPVVKLWRSDGKVSTYRVAGDMLIYDLDNDGHAYVWKRVK